MHLLIDIGNTRIKWGIADQTAALLRSGAMGHDFEEFEKRIQSLSKKYTLLKAIVSAVGDPAVVKQAEAVIQAENSLTIQRFQTQTSAFGVKNAYSDAASLGADRWAAMIAAHRLYRGASLICDCGTATTLDLLDRDGSHLGGYILPGLAMTRTALMSAKLPQVSGGDLLPADNTVAAIANGTVMELVAAIDYVIRQNNEPSCILTGGDAIVVGSLLSNPFHHDPDLVLKGLAIASVAK